MKLRLIADIKPGIKISLLLFFVFSISSCIYYPPEEFTKVSSESPPPDIYDLSQDLSKDTLYLWTATRYGFNFKSDITEVLMVTIHFQGNSLTFGNSAGYFDIDPETWTDGVYNLTIDIFTRTNTGSLADQMNLETNKTTKTWKLVIARPYNQNVKFTGASVENGFLKIHWKKLDSRYFAGYKVMVSDSALYNSYSRSISSADSTSLTDSSFVGGKVTFTLNILYYDTQNILHENTVDTYDYRFPISLNLQDDLDSLTFEWTRIPFNHSIHISSTVDNKTYDILNDSVFKIPSPGLGGTITYTFAVDPVVDLMFSHQMYYIYTHFTAGTPNGMEFSTMVYDPVNDLFLLKYPMYLRTHSGTDFKETGAFNYPWDYYDNSSVAIAPDSRSVLTMALQNLMFMNLPSLKPTASKIPNTGMASPVSYHGMKILDDSIMYLVYNSRLGLFNYRKNLIVNFVSIASGNGMPSQVSFSADGTYAANCGDGYFRIFRNNNNQSLDLIYESAGDYLECIFDQVNRDNLVVSTMTENYVIKCPSMEQVAVIPATIRGVPVNFDPVTNNLLIVSASYYSATVYDYLNAQIKFKSPQHGMYTDYYLAKNMIFQNTGYHYDISAFGK